MTSPDNQGGSGGETSSGKPLDRVGELLKEREQYEQWIAALEAKKDRTPPHVYERVRGDYDRRLKEVIAEITGHAGELQSALEQARERHARLAQQESTRRDERAEMELRHLVGEYTEEQWRVLSTKTDTEINQLAEAREAAKRALAQLEDVVRLATPAHPVGTVAAPGAAPSAPPAAGQPLPKEFDELAFLKSVVGPQKGVRGSGGLTPMPPLPESASSAPPPAAPTAPAAPQIAGLQSTAPPEPPAPAAPVRYATPVGQMPLQPPQPPAAVRRPTPAHPAEPVGAGTPGGHSSPETGKVPAFLKGVPTEQVKTLKCHECGTMNYPTEWYCERCGGEMAAV